MNSKFFSKIVLLAAFGGLAVTGVSLAATSAKEENYQVSLADEPEHVSAAIAWNNQIYSPWGSLIPDDGVEAGAPLKGYCLLINCGEKFFGYNYSVNLALTDNVLSRSIFYNGVALKDISGAVLRELDTKLFMYAPDATTAFTDIYYRPTFEVKDGFEYNSKIVDPFKFVFAGTPHTFGNFMKEPTASAVTFSTISWKGISYDHEMSTNPGILLTYSANLSTLKAESDGCLKKINFAKTIAGDHIFSHGVPLSEIDGAEIKYFSVGHLWVYAPNMDSWDYGQYICAPIRIESFKFMDAIIPDGSYYYQNTWYDKTSDMAVAPTDVSTTGVSWDNIDYATASKFNPDLTYNASGIPQNGYVALLNVTTSLTGASQATVDNYATNLYEIGSNLLINGVPARKVPGTVVRVHAGQLYVSFLDASLTYTGAYYRPTIELAKPAIIGMSTLATFKYAFRNSIKCQTGWVSGDGTVARSTVTNNSITWNDTGYDVFSGKAGFLATFSGNLSTIASEVNGGVKDTRNFAKTDLGYAITLNGKPFAEVEGAQLCYFTTNFLWIYAPSMKTAESGKMPIIEIAQDAVVLDVKLNKVAFTYNATSKWRMVDMDKVNALIDSLVMDQTIENQCVVLYAGAKTAFNACGDVEKEVFKANAPEAYARLSAWAAAHGEVLNGTTLSANASVAFSSNAAVVGIISTILALVAVAGFALYNGKKRKHQ